jgi:tetratricopeptide (TPR) repeat protein
VLGPAEENGVKLWEVASGREVAGWKHHARPVTGVAISPDGRLAVSGALDGRIALWELPSGRTLRIWTGHRNGQVAVAFTEDSQQVLSGGEDTFVKLWSVASGEQLRTMSGHTGNAVWVAAAPGGKLAASAGWDGTLRLWELATGRQLHAFETLGGHRSSMLALSRDGHLAVVATKGPKQGAIGLFDFSLAARYRDFDARVAAAQAALQARPDDAHALAALGHWYAFRGVWSWAAELLEKARGAGVDVSALELGRVYWKKGDYARAAAELEAALAHGEAPAWYLRLCLATVEQERRAPPPQPLAGPPGSKVAELRVFDPETAADWSVQRNLQPGDRAYARKSTTLDRVDPRLRGLDWIQPAEVAKSSSANPLVRLTLREPAELYLAADIIELPRWLQSWESTDLELELRGHPHRVFKKRFVAGPVELGPYDFLDGAMYVVVVK